MYLYACIYACIYSYNAKYCHALNFNPTTARRSCYTRERHTDGILISTTDVEAACKTGERNFVVYRGPPFAQFFPRGPQNPPVP